MGEKATTTREQPGVEHVLGQRLFDRHPHVVPSPTWMSCIVTMLDQERLGDGASRYAHVHPMHVLEAWFDCWAAVAFREPCPAGSCDAMI